MWEEVRRNRIDDSHEAHGEDQRYPHFPPRLHLQSPQHGHGQEDDDQVREQVEDGGVQFETGQAPAVAAWDRFVEAVRVGFADEADGEDDGYEVQDVDHDECLTDQLEGADGEDADVEEEHRYAYADCRRVPDDVDRDEGLFSVNKFLAGHDPRKVAHLRRKARLSQCEFFHGLAPS